MKVFAAAVLFLTLSFNASAWKGVQITDSSQLDEVASFSTAFGYVPDSLENLKNVLDVNQGRMLPIIEISRYFWDYDTGTFIFKDPTELLNALGNHKIMIMLDEPFWWVRQACHAGKQTACNEIAADYINTRQLFKNLKLALGYQMLHVEAFLELNIQKAERPNENVLTVEAADHIAFDCYGAFDDCGGRSQFEYAAWLYDSMLSHQKIFLIAGAFNFADEAVVIDQLEKYSDLYNEYRYLISGIGIFTWGNFDGINGARNIPNLKAQVEYVLQTID
ncbi:hypothetical protein C8R30_101173 [Nitrosomonas nitrosa]|uniref:hypothetical protein n=1 Tax=Nitrosomonas nitrosa TaxID=52442 RepID=UPI000D31BB53|nr:hypothetical protein [Nitrosomonas nitrosa]PTR04976.1 hypothetical protein C8R30_101173 [Nitrosomonas nitrosa]